MSLHLINTIKKLKPDGIKINRQEIKIYLQDLVEELVRINDEYWLLAHAYIVTGMCSKK